METVERDFDENLNRKDSILQQLTEEIGGITADQLRDGVFGAVSQSAGIEFKQDKANNKSYLQSRNFVAGLTGWQIDSDGNIEFNSGTFRGTLSGASGTFGTITAGTISGVSISGSTITGSTLQTGTTGENVDITQGRISQRKDTTEVAYTDVGTYGGWFGLKDTSGNSIGYWNVRSSEADITFRCEVGDLYIDANDDVIFVGSSGNDIYPASDNAMRLGLTSNRWADVRSVLINGADYCFENGFRITEEKDFGISFYNQDDEKIMILDKKGNLWLMGSIYQDVNMKKHFPFYRKGTLIKEK